MDYNRRDFWEAPKGSPKMPFYMAYPMQNVILEEAEYERDMDRLKNLYPSEVKRIQKYVEEECDKMEYEGSMMFDEYPDRVRLRQISSQIYQKVLAPVMSQEAETLESEELRLVGQRRPPSPGFPPSFGPPPMHRPAPPERQEGLSNLIDVLLFNEMYRRRCRHKRCKRWW